MVSFTCTKIFSLNQTPTFRKSHKNIQKESTNFNRATYAIEYYIAYVNDFVLSKKKLVDFAHDLAPFGHS